MDYSCSRRDLLVRTGAGVMAAGAGAVPVIASGTAGHKPKDEEGSQRLSLDKLRQWEALEYGLFIHFGMSTYVVNEFPDGNDPATVYAPDRLDVDQWVSVARDAGMKYAVLTTKHVAGHCLWPSKYTKYTVANSSDKTDVCEKFVEACAKRGVLPGFYYCSWDNHNRFGSQTPSDPTTSWPYWPWAEYNFNQVADEPRSPSGPMPVYTTSIYQGFQTAQITELLTQTDRFGG
ncbi:MAG: alpha-L-fucosidase [Phycisphaerales bacterium]|nr:alpha-L-fucosidase [Phycisphaerales bacterium]